MIEDERGRDPGGMAPAIAALPDQIESGWQAALRDLRGAGWRGPTPPSGAACPAAFAGGVAACGMGGSAIGADMVRAALPRLPVPFESVRGFSLPYWVGRGSITIATSYSGETPETLSCAREAADRGCAPVCVTSGGTLAALALAEGWPLVSIPAGLQPRAALGHLLSAVAAALQAAGLGADLRTQVPEAVELLRSAAAEMGPGADPAADRARAIAARLVGRRVVVYGGGALTPAARRWKTQVNENAKAPACFAEAPELLHNEVCGWADDPETAAETAVVVLVDPAGDDRVRHRLEAVAQLVGRHAAALEVVEARGRAPLARCLWTAHLGDWTSYHLGLARRVDPTPVTAIDELKRLLRERER